MLGEDKFAVGVVVVWLLGVLFYIGCVFGIVYAAIHFITKYW